MRREWGIFRDRRPDLYAPILTLDGGSNIKARDFSTGTGYDDAVEDIDRFVNTNSTPKCDGYFMPAEWVDHECCWMAYPFKKSTWAKNAVNAQKAVINVAKAISKFEPVIMLVRPEHFEQAKKEIGIDSNIRLSIGNYDDIWMRDVGPTYVINGKGSVRGINWKFNGWGEKVENVDIEDGMSSQILKLSSKKGYTTNAVLEGGSIHCDGEGTLLTTEECVLYENRSPNRTKEELNELFATYLGITKVIYIRKGVYMDTDTDGHIDNLCTFIRPGEVLLTFPDDESSPQYPISKEAYDILVHTVDARGRKLIVHKIPHPWPLMVTTAEDLEDLEPQAELVRNEGTILAGSYINYYLANGKFGKGVVMPKFGLPTDFQAFEVMKKLFPDREVIMVEARTILLGGGNIHCITQQQPSSI
jgi:agmatine deiminase